MKILFFSLERGRGGGVQSVNQALSEEFIRRGHTVKEVYLRSAGDGQGFVARESLPWEFTEGKEIKKALREKRFFRALRLFLRRTADCFRYQGDLAVTKEYLRTEKPDCIILSHYLLLRGVPEEFLSRTVCHVHRAPEEVLQNPAHKNTLLRFRGKVRFLWLSKESAKKAEEAGITPSFSIYNPLSVYPEERTEAETKTKISVIARFSPEKRLPLAVLLLKKAFEKIPDSKAFSVEFWGYGEEEEALKSACEGDPRFSVKGKTSDPFSVLAESRFTVNTSPFEGFSVSVLEALAAGVPVVSFDFGSSAKEEIQNGKTGFLLPQGDEEGFVNALVTLLSDDKITKQMSENARQAALPFRKEAVGEAWEEFLKANT